MKSILHLMTQEKITLNTIETFKQLDINNIFLVYKDEYLNQFDTDLKFKGSEFDINKFVRQNSVDGIIIHGLSGYYANLIYKLIVTLKTAWVVWGYDMYQRPQVRNLLYANETSTMINKKVLLKSGIKGIPFLKKLYYLITKKIDYEFYYQKAFNKIDYFASYIYEDFLFFDKYFKHNTSFLYFSSNTLNQYLGGNEYLRVKDNAKNILIGNSNTIENNHLDVFKMLSEISDLNSTELIVPLSYGTDNQYRKRIIDAGIKLFGDNFIPLQQFMPRSKYLELISNCSTAIFYHYRQQAMGNIIALLYMGARIYLSKNNPVYSFCKRIGLHVFDFDSEFKVYRNTKLEEDKAEENREILFEIFNDKAVTNRMNEVINVF
jgi:dTDP-N-acetylfucosamine:lipid II N-acetylfucosaminyltransferase